MPVPEPTLFTGDAATIRDLAEESAAREVIYIGERDAAAALVLRQDQRVHEIDLEQFEETPRRKKGTVALHDADALVAYVLRHASETGTTIWADVDAGRIIAVLDDHNTDGAAGWAQHRAVLTLRQTPDWEHWLKYDGKLLTQDVFAEHLEDGVDAIREPDAATMLEVAQHFHVRRGATFDSARMLSGEIQFGYQENVTASTGKHGTVEIPQTFTLGLAPFEGSDPFALQARFRYRLHDGHLALGYRLIRPDRVRRAAFDEIRERIVTGTDLPVMSGVPRA